MSKNVVDMTLRANMDLSQVSSGLNQMQGILKQLKLSPTLKKEFDSLFSTAAADLEKYQAKLQSGFKTKGDITGFEKIAQSLQGSLGSLEKEWSKLQAMDLGEITRLDSNTINQIKQIEETFKRITSELQTRLTPQIEQVEKSITKLTTTSSKNAGKEILGKLNAGQIKEAEKALDSYIAKQEKALQTFGKKKGVLEDGTPEYDLDDSRTKSLANTLNIYNEIKKQIDNMTSSLGGYNQEASKLKTDKLTIMAEATDKTNQKLQQGSTIISGVTQKTQEYSRAVLESGKKTVELGNDIDMLKNRVSYFFSLTNSVMLFRRILQDTIQTTKELDAAMTETAVVTDFSVADMWKELPRYTEAAKELGATIQGVYETTTLYYQQGLKTNEVFEVGTETLKMAKIAGLDYAQATDFMTAALRGFNMEVNELNAQKVNDVYSELAAITAADTQEIATAMTKTASIASSANMEFETTAAFLSQIIETTRESAETAGTAMKTVIARFTELKKDPAEIGEVDGEIVDANKIETALRTIDVALRDTSGQFRDLDEVFLDIAEKWDGLDTNTQRYIATMAAGSRQQSRFIAMMSDYDRTMQLVSAANNSAGASQKQFDKTLESLEAKLNKLGAAWDQFTMGIANNTLIKAGVDALTGLLNIINKITEHLPGATKGIGNLLLMIGGFTAGKKVMDAFFASTVSNIANLGKVGEKGGATYGITFREALNKEFGKTKQTFLNFKKGLSKDADSIYNLSKNTKIDKQELKNLEKQKNKISGNLSKVGTPERIQQDKEILELEKEIDAVKQKNIATQQLETALGTASREQKAMYLALQQQEISQDLALQALGKDLNDEELQSIVLKALGYEAQDLENEAIKEEVAAKMVAIKTKQQEIATEKMGLLTKAKYVALLFLGNPAQKAEARERLVAAGSTWAQKVALDGLNLSLGWNIALLTIGIALIAGMAIGLAMMAKAAKESSLEYKMEKAAEATEKAKEAAEQAKQAYDDLNSSIENINNKEDAFENLTYGTLEWQKALLEVNQEIMDLIDQFPELKDQLLNELTVEASGKLTLSTDGYNIIKEQSLQYYKNALAGQNIAASYEAVLQKEKALQNYDNYTNDAIRIDKNTGEILQETTKESALEFLAYMAEGFSKLQRGNGFAGGFTLDQTEKALGKEKHAYLTDVEKESIAEAYKIDPSVGVKGSESLRKLSLDLGILDSEILDFIPVVKDLQNAQIEYDASLRAQAQNLLLSTTSNDFQTRENSKQLTDTFSQFFAEQQKDDVQAELVKMNGFTNISDYASELGLTNFFDQGSELENLREMYQRLTGFSEEKIEEMYGESTDALKNAIASIKVGKDWGQRVENFAKELDDFTKDLPKGEKLALEQLFGGADGTGFTQEGMTALQSMMKSSEDGEISELEKFFNENETIKTQFVDEYGEEEAYNKFYEWATEMLGLGTEAFTAAKERLESIGFTDVENFGSTLDSGAVSALTKKIEEVFYRSGEEGASALMTGYNEIIDSFDGDETAIKKFTSALLALDWNSASDIEDFGEILKELGVVVDDVELKEFTSDLIEFNEASSAIDLENLNAQLEELDSIRKQLEDKEYDDFEFTREEKDKLTEIPGINESDFAGYGDSWRYLGDSIGDLITAVNENTAAIIGDTIDELEQQRATAAFLGDEQVNTGNLANYSFEGAEGRGNILASLMNQLTNYNAGLSDENKLTQLGGYDLNSLATLLSKDEKGEYVANENLDSYQQDKLTEVLGELAALLGQEGVLENKIAATKEENAIRQYDNQPVQNVISDATQERTEENADEINAATAALLYKAKGYTQLNDEVKEYNRLMKEGKTAEADAAKKVIATGVAIAENAKKIDKYSDKIQDNISSLEDMNDEGGAYQETLEDTATLVNEMMDADIDASFFSGDGAENLQLLQEGLDGSQEAWNNFVLNMQNAKIQADGFADQFGVSADQILAAVSSLDASSFNIDGSADMTQVVQSLLNAGMTGEEVATFLELLGYTNIELSVDNQITGLEELAEGTDLSALGGSVTVSAVNSYVPAASMANSFGGGGGSSGGGGGGGSGGNSGSEETPWENSFDKFYNITEDINELLEKRNELETEYDLILQDQNASIDDYLKNYTDRIKSFKEEIALQEEMLRLREKDQEEILSEYSHLSEYAWVEDGKVQIDYDAINQVEDQELGEEIEEFVSKLEENDEAIQEANDAIQENTLAIEELLDDWRDATADFEQRVFDAIVAEREKEIEKLEEASDALESSNSDLISAIQKEIDERRQQRENEETEQDLAEKERRLAYLQQDTSGAYDTEILQLEKDLKQQKEDYTDTLIDQRIADLEEQNDEAAKQREKQIQIAQYQLKNEQENGVIARQVSQLLKEANSEAGWNKVWRLLERSDGFSGLTETNKLVWTEDTQSEFKNAMAYLNGTSGGGIAAALANISVGSYESYVDPASNDGDDDDDDTETPRGNGGVTGGGSTSLAVSQVEKNAKGIEYYKIGNEWYKASDTSGLSDGKTTLKEGATPFNKSLMAYQGETTARINNLGTGVTPLEATNNLKKKGKVETIDSVEYFKYGSNYYYVADIGTYSMTTGKGVTHYAFIKEGASYFKKYKTGGLADYTGPAWLDGTKSRPELVLNQKDTQNFLKLKDVLGSFMKQNSTIVNGDSTGDTIYDISISVEKMSSDYDVEQVASKIKQMITNDAAYRNSTMIQRLR